MHAGAWLQPKVFVCIGAGRIDLGGVYCNKPRSKIISRPPHAAAYTGAAAVRDVCDRWIRLIGFWFEIERSGRISMRPDLSFEAGRILCRPQQARSYWISAHCSSPRPYGMSVGPQQAAVLQDAWARGVSGARSSCPAKRGTRPLT